MRSSAISSFALLASSLLVREVLALPINVSVREIYVEIDDVLVTEEVYVTEESDGSYETAVPSAIATSTILGSASLVPETTSSEVAAAATSSSISIPIYTPPVAAASSAAASSISTPVEAQAIATTSSTPLAAPTTSSTSTPIAVPTTTTTLAAAATTTSAVIAAAPTTTLAPVAATTSSAAAVATSATQSSSNKRGLAFNDASLLSGFVSGSTKVSWAYNWGSTASGLSSALEYVPMLWGLRSSNTGSWVSTATAAIAAGSTALLAFNEPDLAAQANLGYADAAAGYLTYMSEPFAGKAKLVSPAVTNGQSPMGLTWLGNFIDACSTCTIDAIALHWYNGGTAEDFISYIEKAYAAGGNRPIWVTEFQASGTSDEQVAFLETVMPWMDSSDMVERYAYFMASDGILLSSGSTLSTLGKTFATA